MKIDNLLGRRFGHLLVEEMLPKREDRYVVYRCRCDCGAAGDVNSNRLKRGTIQGCPDCWRPPSNQPLELVGQRFGELLVVSLSDERKNNRRTWNCICSCGRTAQVTTHDLMSGHTRSCGCAEHRKPKYRDLRGAVIGWLEVLAPEGGRDQKGSMLWRCRCRCGKECTYSEDKLIHGHVKSCGCYRLKESYRKMQQSLHHVDGTCVEFLQRKIRSDNTSGYPGVSRTRNGRWVASITFKKRRYALGTYKTLMEAVSARQAGERMHHEFLESYYQEHPEQIKTRIRRSVQNTAPEKLP